VELELEFDGDRDGNCQAVKLAGLEGPLLGGNDRLLIEAEGLVERGDDAGAANEPSGITTACTSTTPWSLARIASDVYFG
jgi:hypothetical protein